MSKKRNKKVYTGRDMNLVGLICGQTKAGVHLDRKKELDKNECRDWDLEKDVEEMDDDEKSH